MFSRLWQIVPDLATVDALAEPWQMLYAHSTIVATLVLFGHVAGLLVAGALTFSTEAGALRLDPADDGERRRYLRAASPARRAIALALTVAMVSGFLLFLADLEAFAVSPVFWTKMLLVVLLLVNAVVASRLDARLLGANGVIVEHDGLWRRRRASAWATAALWFALVLAGSALASH
jgi:MFS family permease